MQRLLKAALLVVALLASGTSNSAIAAEAWPTRPVRIIAPFAPGGSADTLGRIAAQHFSEVFGQQFVVENRAGAGGLVGSEMVARAAPDGYMLVVSGVASHVLAPALNANAAFDPMKDFTHIALFGGPPGVLVVHPSMPAKNLAEFIALARTKPISYGTPGVGTQGHLTGELLQQVTGITLTHVPYRGAGQIVVDLLANNVPSASNTLSSSAEHIRAGSIRAIAVSSRARLPDFPDIPTYAEQGYPQLNATVWFSLSGPANMPADIVNRLNAETIRALQKPDVRQRLLRDAIDPEPFTSAQFTDFMKAEIARWTPVVKASGATAN